MTVKTIKGIDQETWAEFKSLAARNDMSTGQYFSKIVGEAKKNESERVILNPKSFLTKKESKILKDTCKKIRKEWGYRDVAP